MKLINFFVRCSKSIPYSKRMITLILITSVMGGIANIIVLTVVNKALSGAATAATALVWLFATMAVVAAVNKALSKIMLVHLYTGTVFNLRLEMSQQILKAPLRHLEKLGSHRVLTAFTEDTLVITNALVQLPSLCTNAVIVIGCLFYMLWLSWLLFVLVVGCAALGMLAYHLMEKRATRSFRAARESMAHLMKQFRSLVDGNKELKLHRQRRREFLSENIEATATSVARHRVTATTAYAIAENIGEILIFLAIGLLIFVFAPLQGIAVHVLTGYVIAILYMTTPLQFILNTYGMAGQAEPSIDKVDELRKSLASRITEVEATPTSDRITAWESLELRGITHSYHREKENSSFTLGPINLSVNAGEMLFVTGGNGSGKTTLVKLLSGLYAPEDGAIFLNGKPITDDNRDHYRQYFSVVFSDFFLFDKLHGLPRLDSQVKEYLAMLQLDQKVQVHNGELSTTELSQGQRKRLALLTAYLEDRPIYIFDEWAADQDPQFRDVFYYDLLPDLKARGKTVIVVSHDDRYYHVADRLIKLDYGQLQAAQVPPRTQYVAAGSLVALN
jgi:putative pyoverdin transport system ATP-binding/permease protein